MYQPHRMKFGVFLAPFHRVGENPTLALKRDMQLIEKLDELGYDEVWIGEHHSYARELIGDPFIFIAAAAQRTRRIKLGTGVTSLPYHHPLLVADRRHRHDDRWHHSSHRHPASRDAHGGVAPQVPHHANVRRRGESHRRC